MEAVQKIAAPLNLLPLLDRWTHHLSGGQRRRVHLARSLVDPDCRAFILDEPLAGLDVPSRILVADHLHALAHDGRLVLVATHDLDFAGVCADRVIALRQGRLVLDGGPKEATSLEGVEAIFGVKGGWPPYQSNSPLSRRPINS